MSHTYWEIVVAVAFVASVVGVPVLIYYAAKMASAGWHVGKIITERRFKEKGHGSKRQ